MKRRFPWSTVATLGLGTYGLVHLAIVWWAGWYFRDYFPGETYLNGAFIHGGLVYLVWCWLVLGKALWDRWR